jgi:hypothetical protein
MMRQIEESMLSPEHAAALRLVGTEREFSARGAWETLINRWNSIWFPRRVIQANGDQRSDPVFTVSWAPSGALMPHPSKPSGAAETLWQGHRGRATSVWRGACGLQRRCLVGPPRVVFRRERWKQLLALIDSDRDRARCGGLLARCQQACAGSTRDLAPVHCRVVRCQVRRTEPRAFKDRIARSPTPLRSRQP